MKLLAPITLASALLLASRPALAQRTPQFDENCESVNGGIFESCATLLEFTFYWNYNEADQTLEGHYETNNTGWHAVGWNDWGISTTNAMIGSNAVMGCIEGLTIESADYNLGGKSVTGVTEQNNQNLIAWEQTIEEDFCTVSFTRPLAPAGVDPLQYLNNTFALAVAARGGETLGFHSDRTAYELNFANITAMQTPAPTTPPVNDQPGAASTVAATTALVATLLSVAAQLF